MTPTGALASARSYFFPSAPLWRALMEFPKPQIVLWIVVCCWLLALTAYLFGASKEWILQLLLLGVLTVAAEWVYRNDAE
jgi:hypothetical protein